MSEPSVEWLEEDRSVQLPAVIRMKAATTLLIGELRGLQFPAELCPVMFQDEVHLFLAQ